MMKRGALTAAAVVFALAGTATAEQTTTTNLKVDAYVLEVCTVAKNTDINFGDLNPLADPATTYTNSKTGATRGQITVNCTAGTGYTLSGPSSALMAQGSDTIAYSPIIPAGTFSGSVTGTQHYIDASVNKSAYENVPTGAYTGTLTVTVTY
ncbi:MAG: fimbrial major subunit CsuA/B family protein [Geobacteraceae bacterium]|nr:fimbrial major subunit CsuA/B family protein [Geobacteraceae bacterium]